MRNRKYGLLVVLSAALLITALIASCVNPLDLDLQAPASKSKSTSPAANSTSPSASADSPTTTDISTAANGATNPTTAANMGRILVKIVDNDARTILPSLTASDIHHYDVYAHTDPNVLGVVRGSGSSTTIAAQAGTGTYIITVLGCDSSNNVIAEGKKDDVTVTAGSSNADVAITLSPTKRISTGTGTFAWNITLPTNLGPTGTAIMKLETLSTNADIDGTIFEDDDYDLAVASQNSGNETLNAGYYQVTITFSRTGYQSRTVPAVLHVYEGLTSTYTLNYSSFTLVSNVHTITLDPSGGTLAGGSTIGPISHAGLATAPGNPTPVGSNIFDGWYTTASGTATKWDFDNNKVYGSYTLYARYLALASFNAVVSFTGASEATWSFNGGNTIALTKEDVGAKSVGLVGDFTNITWYLDASGSTAIGNTATLSLSWSILKELVPEGSYKLYVIATPTDSSTPYSSVLATSPTVTIGPAY